MDVRSVETQNQGAHLHRHRCCDDAPVRAWAEAAHSQCHRLWSHQGGDYGGLRIDECARHSHVHTWSAGANGGTFEATRDALSGTALSSTQAEVGRAHRAGLGQSSYVRPRLSRRTDVRCRPYGSVGKTIAGGIGAQRVYRASVPCECPESRSNRDTLGRRSLAPMRSLSVSPHSTRSAQSHGWRAWNSSCVDRFGSQRTTDESRSDTHLTRYQSTAACRHPSWVRKSAVVRRVGRASKHLYRARPALDSR